MKEKGHIKVYRSFFDNFLWSERRVFSKAEAFLDLLQSAHWDREKSGKYMSGNKLITYHRGQLVASIRFLRDRWGWKSNEKVSNFLRLLENDEMIVSHAEHQITVITLCNYDTYNDITAPYRTVAERISEHITNTDAIENRTLTEHKTNTETPVFVGDVKNVPNSEHVSNRTQTEHNSEQEPGLKTNDIKEDKELRINKGVDTSPVLADGERTPPVLSPLQQEFQKIQEFISGASQLKMLKTQLHEKEYFKLRENFTDVQILETLRSMENEPKLLKKYNSIYLTCLTWLKREYGKPELTVLYEKMETAYKVFAESQSGDPPKMDKYEKQALRELAEYFMDKSKDKSVEAVVKNWEYVLSNWKCLDNFMQARIKLQEISKDIIKILKAIKDAANNHQNGNGTTTKDSGGRKTFD